MREGLVMLFLQRFQSLLLGTTAPCAFLSKVQGVFRVKISENESYKFI